MSTLLEQASLVMIPSGYKEDVVYSQIPTSGAGDLSFTRASNGTRINSAGLVEVTPWNLFTYSEDFANADWIKVGSTISSNVLVAPNGTTTADKLVEDTSNGVHIALQISGERNVNSIYAFSVYAKAGERTKINLFNNGNGLGNANFDLSNGTATLIAGEFATIESVGNGWYRCVVGMQENSTVGNFNYHIRLLDASGSDSYTGNGTSGAYIWGAQVNLGTAKPYFPTTDRLNVPRLTYQNGGGGCPSLLLEKQSTNVNEKSNDFTLAANYWYEPNSKNPTANQGTSPDGTNNAWSIQSNSFLTTEYGKLIGLTIGDKTAGSIWAKGSETAFTLSVRNTTNSDILGSVTVNLTTGAITSGSGTVESFGNGWYRISTIGTSTITNGYPRTVITNPNTSCLIYGSQFEASSYPTSYIPTTSSSATRVADACSKTGISSLIGQTQGTWFADIVRTTLQGSDTFWLNISDNSSNNWIFMGSDATGGRFYLRASSTTVVDQYPSLSLGRHKLAIAYQSGSIVGYIDGTQVFSSSATYTFGSLTGINLGYSGASLGTAVNTPAQVNQVALFPTRLSNSELASLTTI